MEWREHTLGCHVSCSSAKCSPSLTRTSKTDLLAPFFATSWRMQRLSSAFDPSSPEGWVGQQRWVAAVSHPGILWWSNLPIPTPYYWVPSNEAKGTIFTVFGTTRRGTKPTTYPSQGRNATARPLSWYSLHVKISSSFLVWVIFHQFEWITLNHLLESYVWKQWQTQWGVQIGKGWAKSILLHF